MEFRRNIAEIFEKHRGEKHLVVLHDYPDPDAISSAMAHRLISAEYGIDVDVIYTGKISHSITDTEGFIRADVDDFHTQVKAKVFARIGGEERPVA